MQGFLHLFFFYFIFLAVARIKKKVFSRKPEEEWALPDSICPPQTA